MVQQGKEPHETGRQYTDLKAHLEPKNREIPCDKPAWLHEFGNWKCCFYTARRKHKCIHEVCTCPVWIGAGHVGWLNDISILGWRCTPVHKLVHSSIFRSRLEPVSDISILWHFRNFDRLYSRNWHLVQTIVLAGIGPSPPKQKHCGIRFHRWWDKWWMNERGVQENKCLKRCLYIAIW